MAFVDFLEPAAAPGMGRTAGPRHGGAPELCHRSRNGGAPNDRFLLRKVVTDRNANSARQQSQHNSSSSSSGGGGSTGGQSHSPALSPASSPSFPVSPMGDCSSEPGSPDRPSLKLPDRRLSLSSRGPSSGTPSLDHPSSLSARASPHDSPTRGFPSSSNGALRGGPFISGSASPFPGTPPRAPGSTQAGSGGGRARALEGRVVVDRSLTQSGSTRSGTIASLASDEEEESEGGEGGGDLSTRRLLAQCGEEDLANDEALGQYLAATQAAARSRRQRAAAEAEAAGAVPLSQQFLSSGPTARNRRMSSDSAVSEVRPWVNTLEDPTAGAKAKREAARALRIALKDGPENRMRLVGAGGVRPLVMALSSSDPDTVEQAAAAVVFLSMAGDSAREVVGCGGVRKLVELVGNASAAESSRSGAAAALFALSHDKENRKMVHQAGAIGPLMALLKCAKTPRGKKDSCLALFSLTSTSKGVETMLELGVVERTVEVLEEAEEGVEEKVAALIAGLARSPEGAEGLIEEEDALYALTDTLEGGSTPAAQQAALALLRLATAHPKVVPKILAEGCLPPLVRLACQSKKGSDSRALLEVLRTHCAQVKKDADSLGTKVRSLDRGQHSRPSSLDGSPAHSLQRLPSGSM